MTLDVLVIGGGNAALCAALMAREAGASVMLLESAPREWRGGNSIHTRNLRCMHDAPQDELVEAYPEEEFWQDLLKVTGGLTNEHLARLAIRHSDDYKAAQVPMLPTVVPMKQTLRAMLRYTVALVVASLVLIPVGDLGVIYGVSAAVLGVFFLLGIGYLWRTPTEAVSMRVFSYSISYISLLFGAITVDVLVKYGVS